VYFFRVAFVIFFAFPLLLNQLARDTFCAGKVNVSQNKCLARQDARITYDKGHCSENKLGLLSCQRGVGSAGGSEHVLPVVLFPPSVGLRGRVIE
jgi:hypothetical protein